MDFEQIVAPRNNGNNGNKASVEIKILTFLVFWVVVLLFLTYTSITRINSGEEAEYERTPQTGTLNFRDFTEDDFSTHGKTIEILHPVNDRAKIFDIIARGLYMDVVPDDHPYKNVLTAFFNLPGINYPLYAESEDVFSAEYMYSRYVHYMLVYQPEQNIVLFDQYLSLVSFWEERIPKKFVYAMFNESLKQRVPMEYVYSIAVQETIDFRYFESLQPNRDKTIDVGLMGLNASNFERPGFIRQFFRFDGEYENVAFNPRDEFHILKACVAYFKHLVDYTGGSKWHALVCYNGGPASWKKGKPPKAALTYAERVYNRTRSNTQNVVNMWDVGVRSEYVVEWFAAHWNTHQKELASTNAHGARRMWKLASASSSFSTDSKKNGDEEKKPFKSLFDNDGRELYHDRRKLFMFIQFIASIQPDNDEDIKAFVSERGYLVTPNLYLALKKIDLA